MEAKSVKIKFRNQLRKEGYIAKQGYGNGYSIFKNNKIIGFISFSNISPVYYDWEVWNKGNSSKKLINSVEEGGYLN